MARPLLLVGAGLGVVTIVGGCFTSGNLMGPPPCTDAGVPAGCEEAPSPGVDPCDCPDGGLSGQTRRGGLKCFNCEPR